MRMLVNLPVPAAPSRNLAPFAMYVIISFNAVLASLLPIIQIHGAYHSAPSSIQRQKTFRLLVGVSVRFFSD